MRLQLFFLVLLLAPPTIVFANSFWKDVFSSKVSAAPSFSGSGLFTADIGLSDLPQGAVLAAFGDFDSDTYSDLFVVRDSSSVQVWKWKHDQFKYVPLPGTVIRENNIVSVIPGDFNYDGKLDVLIQLDSGNNTFESKIWLGSHTDLVPLRQEPIAKSKGQITVVDADGDMKLDLFGISLETGRRTFWINHLEAEKSFTEQFFSTDSTELPLIGAQTYTDIDGDCRADLLLTACEINAYNETTNKCKSPRLEVWLNEYTPQGTVFRKNRVLTLPNTLAGHISFADLDGDGAIDFLVPVTKNTTTKEAALMVAYNTQMKLCTKYGQRGCREIENLCVADPNFKLPNLPDVKSLNAQQDIVLVSGKFATAKFTQSQQFPLSVRIGDYNNDGFPDLLIPLDNGVQLWESIECTESLGCSSQASSANRRTFAPVSASLTSELTRLNNVETAAFLDIDETGVLDIVVLSTKSYEPVVCLINQIYSDAFFMKTLGLNGVCAAWCPHVRFPNPKPYGVSFPGGTFKFTVTLMSGRKRIATGTQLSQSSHHALQTPYLLFGLGRTNNYIEWVFYGASVNQATHWHSWTPVIPNSQVVAIPYPLAKPLEWTLETYIAPSGVTLWVIVAVILALFVNFLLIMFFRWQERKEDEKEKREKAHLFSFDAL